MPNEWLSGITEDFESFKEFVDEYTGCPDWHAVYTVKLGELIQTGVFDWKRPELDWSEAAYDAEQYVRVCKYFERRFYYREISLEPALEWFNMLQYRLIYELMPKYKPLYQRVADGLDPLAESDEYYKRRTINSAYPETLLSGNSDYISDGTDEEWERIKEGQLVDAMNKYVVEFHAVDESLLDECEDLFTCMYTANTNGL